MATHRPPNPGSTTDQSDKPVGIALIVLTIIFTLSEVFWMTLFGWLMGEVPMEPDEMEEANVLAVAIAMLAVWTMVLGIVNVVVGFGIYRSMHWAFVLGMAFNAITVLGNIAIFKYMDIEVTAISAAVTVYCWLRLAGRFGPRPN